MLELLTFSTIIVRKTPLPCCTNNTTMGSPNNDHESQIAVISVPFPAQSHLNQLLQLSCLISTHSIPVHYVASAIHNRQAKVRSNSDISKIHFHDLPNPPFDSPPPDPNSISKIPTLILPAWNATLNLRQPVAAYIRDVAKRFRRVVVLHDPLVALVVQDVASVPNAESYALNCISAFSQISIYICELQGNPFPVEHPKELPSFEGLINDEILYLANLQSEPLNYRAGDIHNTCRLIEAPYLEVLEREEHKGNRKSWAIGPILPTKLSSIKQPKNQHKSLEWLDKQEPRSVMYISFGTTVSPSDEQIEEMAFGLEQSKVKFLWVLREADTGNVFDAQVRRAELPDGFEERVDGVGLVVRDWAPQTRILAHPSTGGFMSHCGWNSCMESITMGVPIAAWPMHSDQPRNTSLITDILKIALEVREWTPIMEVVKASTIENVVRRLMASEEGNNIRKRVEELGATVRQATEPGGVSHLELDSFIDHITR